MNFDILALFMFSGSLMMASFALIAYQYIKEEKHRRYNKLYIREHMTHCPQEIGSRMRFFERYTEDNIAVIPETHSFIVKLDGRNFSRLLSEYNNNCIENNTVPYSSEIQLALEYTVADCMREFHARAGYVYSDKMLLVFPPERHIFGGRVNRLHSAISSYATSRFITNLNNINGNTNNNHFINSLLTYNYCKLSFISTIAVFPDFNPLELVNYLAWHNNGMAEQKFKQHLMKYYCQGDNVNIQNLVNELEDEYNINYHDINTGMRQGVYIKKQEYNNVVTYIKFILPKVTANKETLEFMFDKSVQEWELRLITDDESIGFVEIERQVPVYDI